MQYLPKEKSQQFVNGKTCTVYEYDFGSEVMDTARIEISGRYPEVGFAQNTVCTELAYVLKGSCVVTVNGVEQVLAEGDSVLINPKDSFCWDGTVELLITCTPKWNKDQYVILGV
jgi:mannose-6-phosphate isomerase-like protein (cupin superfamily)